MPKVNQQLCSEAASLRHQVEVWQGINRLASSVSNIDLLLSMILKEAEAAVGADASCLGLVDHSKGLIRIKYATGSKKDLVRDYIQPIGKGIIGYVAATGVTARVDNVTLDSRFDPTVDQITGFSTRCVLAAPIKKSSQVFGVLEVLNKSKSPSFTRHDSQLLEIVAWQSAVALGRDIWKIP